MFSSIFGFKTEVFGLDIGLHSIRGAQLRNPKQHAGLVGLGEVALGKKVFEKDKIINNDVLTEAIKTLLSVSQPNSLSAKAVVAALPENFIFTRVIQLPNLPPKELQKAISYEAGQYLPVPTEDVYFDYTPLALRPDKQQIDAALFAAPKELVDGLIDIIHSCGLELSALETKSTAISRALLPAGTEQAVLMIDIGSESTRMTLSDHGSVWLTTSVANGEIQLTKLLSDKLGKTGDDLKKFLKDARTKETAAVLTGATASIVSEAVSVCHYHETRDFHANKVERAIVVGQGAVIPGVTESIIDALHIKCEPGLPLVNSDKPISPQYSVALGLSMRQL